MDSSMLELAVGCMSARKAWVDVMQAACSGATIHPDVQKLC